SKELHDAILVNPNDVEEVASAIGKAITMNEEEQVRHMGYMQDHVRKYDVFQWVNVFMDRLAHVKKKQSELKSRRLKEIDFEQLKQRFKVADKPLILLDYDGTLVGYQPKPEDAS